MNTTSRTYIEVVAADLAAIRERLAPYRTKSPGDHPAAHDLAVEAASCVRVLTRFISETPANRKAIAEARLRLGRLKFADEPEASFAITGYICERLLVVAAGLLCRAIDLEEATLPGARAVARDSLYGIIGAFGAGVGDLSEVLGQIR